MRPSDQLIDTIGA